MICIICGLDISALKQRPIPIKTLEFQPFIGQEAPGQDVITAAICCQDCYAKIHANRAKAIAEYGKLKDPKE